MAGLAVWVCVCLLFIMCAVIGRTINQIQPLPYMDEVFHVPQVQSYCAHNFSHWDSMITTLPGLYISSLLWIEPVSWLLPVPTDVICSTPVLRIQNMCFTVANFLLIHQLLQRLHKTSKSPTDVILSSLTLSSFPVLFFFSFLYYTDVGSVLLLLLAYSLSLTHRHFAAATALLLAICFRQTSIVWAGFVAGAAGLQLFEPQFYHDKKAAHPIISYVSAVVKSLAVNLPSLLRTLWPYLIVLLAFISFVIWNGSIVVGDKAHHQASLNLPQVGYFAVFTCVFASGPLIINTRLVLGFLRRLKSPVWIVALVVLVLLGLAAVHLFTHVHPYLLADNRHYPFYVWKNIFHSHPAVKYLLVPVYAIAMLYLIFALSRTQSILWVLLFSLCTMASLIPQALLEFRYFIFPYLLLRLHLAPGSWLALLGEAVLYSLVNVSTIYLFLYRSFHWPDSAHPQRFMW